MLVAIPTVVVRHTTAVDYMLCLLGDVALMRLQVELVTATAQLVGSVILQTQTSVVCRAVVCAQAKGIHVQLAKFREAVAIVVIRVTVAVVGIHSHAILVVGRHKRHIRAHALLPCLAAVTCKIACYGE